MGRGSGGGGAGSLRDLVETLYEDLFAYQTIKVVKTKDWRLGTMKRTFNAGVLIYVLFFMVLYHGYLQKEVPVVSVNTGVTDAPLKLMLANFSRIGFTPDYCYPDKTNYTYSADRDYSFNQCADYYTPAEFTEKGFMSTWLYTYWQQTLYNRSCVPATIPPGQRLSSNFNLSLIPLCSTPYQVSNASVFPVAAEYTLLTVTGTYTTSWGRTRSNVNATFMPSDTAGVTPLGINSSLNYPPGTQISFTFKQILDLAGIDLDAPNELNDGGLGPPWPRYRITGIELAVDMVYQNYVEKLLPFPDPFNFQDTLQAKVYPASRGTFRSPGTKLWYVGHDVANPEATFLVRTPQGVVLTFSAAGSIGNFSFKAALQTLLGAMVLFGAATNLIDISAAFVIEGFREQKFEDGLDLRIREMLRSQLSDVPTRAEIDEYELKRSQAMAVAEQEAEAERERDLKARERELKRGKDRLGDAALPEINGAELAQQQAQQTINDAIEDAEKRGITLELDTPKRAKQKKLKGFKRGLEPRVARLIIAGEPFHGLTLTAQGFLENCRCVRFQWLRSRDGQKFLAVPGATLPTFFANADDLGHILRVEATPVTDDGYEGEPVTADTLALATRLNIRAQVRKLVAQARLPSPAVQGFLDVTDGLQVAGMRATMRISADEISCRTKTSIELGAIKTTECKVILDRNDHCRMRLEDAEKMFFDVTFRNGEERDVYALTLRELAGDSLELRNAPEYMAGYTPPSDDDGDEEGDGDGQGGGMGGLW